MIISRSYRSTHPAPYELPKHNTLSTLKSKEHKGQRGSELCIDDPTAQISVALMNDHGVSALHLGYLTHPRPEGFELRSDKQGALRAAKGLLLSAGGPSPRRKPATCNGPGANDEADDAGPGGQALIAQHGEVLMQAQHNSPRLEADKHVEITATQEYVQISAQEHITLLCGGAYLKLQGGNIGLGMLGTFTVKASQHHFSDPSQASPSLSRWSAGADEHWIGLHFLDADSGQGRVGAGYQIHFFDGDRISGTLDEQGQARHDNRSRKAVRRVEYSLPSGPTEVPHPALELLLSGLQKDTQGGSR